MYALIAAYLLCSFLYISVLALVGTQLGVCLREISFGAGPVIARWGRVQFKVLPWGGAAKFKDSRAEDLESWERGDAFDAQPLHRQLLLVLSGPLFLLGIGFAVMPGDTFPTFKDGFEQLIGGASSPLIHAQDLLAQASQVIRQLSFVSLIALAAIKMAALNLLPLPALNGGALVALAASKSGFARTWRPGYTHALQLVHLALLLLWQFAWIVYLV